MGFWRRLLAKKGRKNPSAIRSYPIKMGYLEPPVKLHLQLGVEKALIRPAPHRKDAGDSQARRVEHQGLHADRAVAHIEAVRRVGNYGSRPTDSPGHQVS